MANLGFDKPGIGWNMEDFYNNENNVLMEWHKYLCFDWNFTNMSTNDVITKGPEDIKKEIDAWTGS